MVVVNVNVVVVDSMRLVYQVVSDIFRFYEKFMHVLYSEWHFMLRVQMLCVTLLMTITYIPNFGKLKNKLYVGEMLFAIAENHKFLTVVS